jgi:undecaprenyl-phosphate 4-deoxy-4-formamido-L-arabinose transferase
MITLSVVVPVYRSSKSIYELYSRICTTLEKNQVSFEIIFVEDCGGDNSWEIICDLALQNTKVEGIRLSRNYGQHNALLAGIRLAKGKFIVTMDDDLQHPPEEIPKLILKIQEGYDVVYGSPTLARQSLFRNIASKLTKIVLQKSMGAEVAKQISAFRLFKSELRKAFVNYDGPSVNIDVLLTWGSSKFSSASVHHDARKYGKSNYSIFKLSRHALDMVTGFSTLPLRISGIIGFLFSLFGLLILLFVILRYLISGVVVPGFTFLASIISVFSGAQLLALGIIGEYLARMHHRTLGPPPFMIKESTNKNINTNAQRIT